MAAERLLYKGENRGDHIHLQERPVCCVANMQSKQDADMTERHIIATLACDDAYWCRQVCC